MSNSVFELLSKAQDLIRDPKNWTQGKFARNAEGGYVHVHSEQAVCFCSLGAIERLTVDDWELYTQARGLLWEVREEGPVNINDLQDHAAVMAMFDDAKELANAAAA